MENIMLSHNFDKNNHFYKLADGRVWSTAKAKFVPEQEAKYAGFDEIPTSPVDKNQQHTLEGLREALVFYDLPLGELKYQAIPLNDAKTLKLEELNTAFHTAESDGVVMSSLGFVINADERANRDINGLITGMTASGMTSTMFCAADNSFHSVTVDNLKTMLLEIIQHGQNLYAQKWAMRSAIEDAKTLEDVAKVEIVFHA